MSKTSAVVSYFPSASNVLSLRPAARLVYPAESLSPHSLLVANVGLTDHWVALANCVPPTRKFPNRPVSVLRLDMFFYSSICADHDDELLLSLDGLLELSLELLLMLLELDDALELLVDWLLELLLLTLWLELLLELLELVDTLLLLRDTLLLLELWLELWLELELELGLGLELLELELLLELYSSSSSRAIRYIEYATSPPTALSVIR